MFIMNNLATGMSPYAKTMGSRGNFGGYSTEGERLRHFTTTRSKRSVYRQLDKRSWPAGYDKADAAAPDRLAVGRSP